jgi:ketosteroid isomerase-like protein
MFVNRTSILLLIALLFMIVSCSQQDKMEIEKSASAFDIKQGEASIAQANQNFIKAYKARDTSQIAQAFTSNAKVMVANHSPIEGRNNVSQFFAGLMKDSVTAVKLNTSKISGDSTVLVEEGTYQFFNEKGTQTDNGQYIALWQQQAGNWKIYRDMMTSSVPKAMTKTSDSTND